LVTENALSHENWESLKTLGVNFTIVLKDSIESYTIWVMKLSGSANTVIKYIRIAQYTELLNKILPFKYSD
jgi:hypothetical protein